MNTFDRVLKIIQAQAHAAVDHLESPETMIDQAIRDHEKAVADARVNQQTVVAQALRVKAERNAA
ncbi:MAG: PspA/IM30 family protein, partial [Proteobacteria bacterium]|nr:PspA/IM30 family protein [Pseudomonadota bacterium]